VQHDSGFAEPVCLVFGGRGNSYRGDEHCCGRYIAGALTPPFKQIFPPALCKGCARRKGQLLSPRRFVALLWT
jgi:hypothetical protein